jgi:hypothetical protein
VRDCTAQLNNDDSPRQEDDGSCNGCKKHFRDVDRDGTPGMGCDFLIVFNLK